MILSLTSIRGFAAWWIVVYHFREYLPTNHAGPLYSFFSYGYHAVDLFFILSGFVIQLNYDRLFGKPPTKNALKQFALARFARVYPLHIFMMTLFIVNPIAIALFSHQGLRDQINGRYNPIDYLFNVFLIQNWGFRDHLSWNIPAWSISTEFGAYIIFPVASYCALRYLYTRAAASAGIFILLISLCSLFWVAGTVSIGDNITSLGLPRCVLQFMTGVLLCVFFKVDGPPENQLAPLIAAAAICAIGTVYKINDYLWLPLCFTITVYALTCPTGVVTKFLTLRPFVYLGEISYATYLCHFFVKDWVKFVVQDPNRPAYEIFIALVSITFVVSMALYKTVELPMRRRLRALVRTGHEPVAATPVDHAIAKGEQTP